jgi:hypothetical protein
MVVCTSGIEACHKKDNGTETNIIAKYVCEQ